MIINGCPIQGLSSVWSVAYPERRWSNSAQKPENSPKCTSKGSQWPKSRHIPTEKGRNGPRPIGPGQK